jgi:hypothetical protein
VAVEVGVARLLPVCLLPVAGSPQADPYPGQDPASTNPRWSNPSHLAQRRRRRRRKRCHGAGRRPGAEGSLPTKGMFRPCVSCAAPPGVTSRAAAHPEPTLMPCFRNARFVYVVDLQRLAMQKPCKAHASKRDKTFRIGTPMRKVSWTKRFAAEARHIGGPVRKMSRRVAMGTNAAALGVGDWARCAQHEEGRVLVASRTRPNRVLRSVVGQLGQVTLGTPERDHSEVSSACCRSGGTVAWPPPPGLPWRRAGPALASPGSRPARGRQAWVAPAS